jgi:hypothetical protein
VELNDHLRSRLLRETPRVKYQIEVKNQSHWTCQFSKWVDSELEIEPVTVSDSEFDAYLAFYAHKDPNKLLHTFREKGAIDWYHSLTNVWAGPSKSTCLFEIKSTAKDDIVSKMSKRFFDLAGPIRVKGDNMLFSAYTLDIDHADDKFGELVKAIMKDPHCSIVGYKKELVEPQYVAKRRLDATDLRLLRDLDSSRYFDPNNKKRPSQKSIAKKLGVSVGQVNLRLRMLQDVAFMNLNSLPDVEEFKSIFARIEGEDQRQDLSLAPEALEETS